MKRSFFEKGLINENEELDVIKLKDGFLTDLIDIEIFKQALK